MEEVKIVEAEAEPVAPPLEQRPRVWFLRHGESEANANKEFNQPDPALTINGQTQAAKIVRQVDWAITSSLKRSKETLDYSNIVYKKRSTFDPCREQRFNITDLMPGEEKHFNGKPEQESSVQQRVAELQAFLWANFIRDPSLQTVIIVGHACFIATVGVKGSLSGGALENCEIVEWLDF